MATTSRIELERATEPVTGYVTKFGGQPTWVETPQWPLSRATGNPMRFIAQIAMEPPAFAGSGGKMAYVFITDEEEYVDATWEPEGGENAVVVQPGTFSGPTTQIAAGPSLYRMLEVAVKKRLIPEAVEFRAQLRNEEEPDYQPESVRSSWTDRQFETYAQRLGGNKVGGTPIFLQGDEFPAGNKWKLLLQLDSTAVPFNVNFGDGGIAYAFVDSDEREGKLLWQCS